MRQLGMIVIGVVGVPAGGKSTVARHLRALGATWIHADRLAHRCLNLASVRVQLAAYFGQEVVGLSGTLDRRRIAERVFGDDEASHDALHYLEEVVHRQVRHMALRRLTRASRRGIPIGVLDAPLLLEADWGVICDLIWCVDTPESLRASWIGQRGWTLEELRRRERRQLSISEKRRLSTHVLINDRDQKSLIDEVERLWGLISQSSLSEIAVGLHTPPSHCLSYRNALPYLP